MRALSLLLYACKKLKKISRNRIKGRSVARSRRETKENISQTARRENHLTGYMYTRIYTRGRDPRRRCRRPITDNQSVRARELEELYTRIYTYTYFT